MRFLFAISCGLGSENAPQEHGSAKHGIILGIVIRVAQFIFNGHMVFLCPFNESAFEVFLRVHQVHDIDMIANNFLFDEFSGTFVALVEIDGTHKSFHHIATDVAIVRRRVC